MIKKIKKIIDNVVIACHPKSIKASSSYAYAQNQADKSAYLTGNRHYVLCDDDGKLIIVDNTSFWRLKRKHKIPQSITGKNLCVQSLYYSCGRFVGYKKGKFQDVWMKGMPVKVIQNKKRLYRKFMMDR